MMKLQIRRPDDMHRHLRRYGLLTTVAQFIGPYARAVAMGNTKPPIANGQDVIDYRREIKYALPQDSGFEALIAIKALDATTPQVIDGAYEAGAAALKVYFRGSGTTNAEDGIAIKEIDRLWPTLDRMQDINRKSKRKMLALWHGEHPNAEDGLEQEREFLPIFEMVVKLFPGLNMVLEHISTKEAANLITNLPDNAAATITPHHLRITHDHITRWGLRPHNYCRPEAQFAKDRAALIQAAISGNPKFFLGTDDAAHPKQNKECKVGSPGVFTGPYSLGHYAQVFEEAGEMGKLEDFASRFGAEFYGLPLNEGLVELVRQPFIVPELLDGIVPFMAGDTLNWQIA